MWSFLTTVSPMDWTIVGGDRYTAADTSRKDVTSACGEVSRERRCVRQSYSASVSYAIVDEFASFVGPAMTVVAKEEVRAAKTRQIHSIHVVTRAVAVKTYWPSCNALSSVGTMSPLEACYAGERRSDPTKTWKRTLPMLDSIPCQACSNTLPQRFDVSHTAVL
ncbi:hypothetical protein KCU95_g64, partial [Aureobasidium melanogenum]